MSAQSLVLWLALPLAWRKVEKWVSPKVARLAEQLGGLWVYSLGVSLVAKMVVALVSPKVLSLVSASD